jgi:hypothetical protein
MPSILNQPTPEKFATLLFGSAALVALVSATPVAHAQGVPAGLLRLDYSQQYFQSHPDSSPFAGDAAVQFTDQQRARVNNTYARARKSQLNH